MSLIFLLLPTPHGSSCHSNFWMPHYLLLIITVIFIWRFLLPGLWIHGSRFDGTPRLRASGIYERNECKHNAAAFGRVVVLPQTKFFAPWYQVFQYSHQQQRPGQTGWFWSGSSLQCKFFWFLGFLGFFPKFYGVSWEDFILKAKVGIHVSEV